MNYKLLTAVVVVLVLLVAAVVYRRAQEGVVGAPDGTPVKVKIECAPGTEQWVTAVYGSPWGLCRKRLVSDVLNSTKMLETGFTVSPEILGVPPCKGGGALAAAVECKPRA
jgi:ABC-type cobalt transport system substrate-binding protein